MPDESYFLIIECGDTFTDLTRERGGFADWLRQGCGWPEAQTRIWRPYVDEAAPCVEHVRALVISGSRAMVSHREPWSERVAEWLRHAVGSGFPILGVCYGHQLLAHALGGQVGPNPRGPEFGGISVCFADSAKDDPLFASLPAVIVALVSHSESVLELPEGAWPLAASDRDEHQAVRYGDNVWGVQFHPEFDAHITRYYVRAVQEKLLSCGQNPEQLLASCVETPESASVLKRFGRLALGSGAHLA